MNKPVFDNLLSGEKIAISNMLEDTVPGGAAAQGMASTVLRFQRTNTRHRPPVSTSCRTRRRGGGRSRHPGKNRRWLAMRMTAR
jgi:hypothetical protein